MIHLVVVTDDHSWVAGQGRHSNNILNADYGHVLSFYEHFRKNHNNTFLVMNGDFMDGTGLSTYPPTHLTPILQAMHFDAMTLGNHDIYKNETIQYYLSKSGFMQETYMVTSNVIHTSTRRPLGQRYLYLHGDAGATVLVLGFLLDIDTYQVGSPLVRVEPIQQVVKQAWFASVLQNTTTYDAIVILAHMGTDDPSISILLQAIRNIVGPSMPIQFVTGHTHLLRHAILDPCATAVEAGKYLETVGLVSFPTKSRIVENNHSCGNLFSSELLPARVRTLARRAHVFNDDNFLTPNGKAVQELIRTTRDEMGLLRVVGCAPQTYHLNQTLTAPDSLFGLWHQVLKRQFLESPENRVVLQGTRSSFRNDLIGGNITMDDMLIVSPFNDTMYLVAHDISESTLERLTMHMNSLHQHDDGFVLPDFVILRGNTNATTNNNHQSSRLLDLYTLEYEVPFLQRGLQHVLGSDTNVIALQTPIPIPSAAATTLWLEFLERNWPTCRQAAHSNVVEKKQVVSQEVLLPTPDLVIPGACAVIALLLCLFFVWRIAFPKKRMTTPTTSPRRLVQQPV